MSSSGALRAPASFAAPADREALEARVALQDAWIARIEAVCRQAAHGHLEGRLLYTDEGGSLRNCIVAVNDLLDTTDAFVREASVSLDCASADRFHRRLLPGGLDGAFLCAADKINGATDRMEERHVALLHANDERVRLADSFEHDVGVVVETTASAATELQATAECLTEAAESTFLRAKQAGDRATQVARRAVEVSDASDTLARGIQTIGSKAGDSQTAAQTAALQLKLGEQAVQTLEEAAASAHEAISLIASIARQTNLLALNAAIEAARAGSAGRGFGVVASEVKALASQTAQASRTVDGHVRSILRGTQSVTEAFGTLQRNLHEMQDASLHTLEAVQVQLSTTDSMRAGLGEVREHTQHLGESVLQVRADVEQSKLTSGDLLTAADGLSRQAEGLNCDVRAFLDRIRG